MMLHAWTARLSRGCLQKFTNLRPVASFLIKQGNLLQTKIPHQSIHTPTNSVRRLFSFCGCIGLSSRNGAKNYLNIHSRSVKSAAKSWNISGKVPKDTTIFSYSNDTFYRMMTIFGIVQFVSWGCLAMFVYNGLKAFEEHGPQNLPTDTFSGSFLKTMLQYKYKIAILCVTLGYVVLFFTWIFPQRTITRLQLLRGGEELKITTYKHLARRKQFTVPLEDISCYQQRTSSPSQISMKIKDKWFYYQFDNRDGIFHEPDLFDYVVGLERNLKKK